MLKNNEILCKVNKDNTIDFYCKVSINEKAIEQLLKKQSPDGFKVIWISD